VIVQPAGHPGPCVIVTSVPATCSTPVRMALPVCPATAYLTVPVPWPLAPPATVSHDSEVVAVQGHPAVVDTEIDP
jgi:hypothetical protein